MRALLLEQDRDTREHAWRKAYARQMQDRDALNDLWGQMLDIRLDIAANAGKPTFRDYAWIQRDRYDYTPADDLRFLDAIEEVVVPAMLRRMEQRKRALGLDALRPWDMHVDTSGDAPLKPFEEVDTLIAGCASIFEQIDPELSTYYNSMRDSGMLDLDNRKGKAPGGYCTGFPLTGQSFIFMNAVATHDDVQTLLHESGHAFHNFESSKLPYIQQTNYPTEFAEVASMTMELLAAPYLVREKGGFYTPPEAARARIEHLEGILNFWPYMAVVDGFQHWVYTHPDDARDPANCDAKWLELWDRFLPGVDWSGLEDIKATGWHRKLHIFHLPFYYIEYGLAQLGAVQIWRNALADAPAALEQYRGALALGNTRKLPDLFAAAGAKLAFDPVTLGEAVALIEQVIEELETQI
jgi:oligoendopeptidase F